MPTGAFPAPRCENPVGSALFACYFTTRVLGPLLAQEARASHYTEAIGRSTFTLVVGVLAIA